MNVNETLQPSQKKRRDSKPAADAIDPQVSETIRSVLNLVSVAEGVDEDIFLISYPKSGNTWFRTLVAGVIYGLDPEYAPYPLVSDVIPAAHRNGYYKRYQTPMFFKSHYLPQPRHKRVVYILRDGRDAMVSCWHHLQAVKGREIDFLKVVQGEELPFPYYKWHEHVEAWLSNPYQAQMLLIKYEDLKNDPVKELRRFCEFAGVTREDSFLALTAQKAAFEKMREKEARDGIGISRWPKDKFSIRRGQVGSYKDEMPPEILEIFLKDAGETLRKAGYL